MEDGFSRPQSNTIMLHEVKIMDYKDILICKNCVKPYYHKFKSVDAEGNITMEWRCLECGRTDTGITLLEIFQMCKDMYQVMKEKGFL